MLHSNENQNQEETVDRQGLPHSTGIREVPAEIYLTEEQTLAVTLITTWLEDVISPPEFKLGGYAGTGKTTVIKFLIAALRRNHRINVAAFTGKAVSVLGRKGVFGQTLHSLMYDVTSNSDGTVKFTLKSKLDGRPDLIIIDEASMVSKELLTDLRLFGVRLLFVGDPGQLEPVGDNPNLMKSCDFVLSKIHRQAELSHIITLANTIRNGGVLKHQTHPSGVLTVKDKSLTATIALAHDQIICAKNATRTKLNTTIRAFLSKHGLMTVGEKIMVLKNSRLYGVFNGLILTVEEIIHEDGFEWTLNCVDEVGGQYRRLPVWKKPYTDPELFAKKGVLTPICPAKVVETGYAYAITCHKAQGSEWDSVLVVDEWMPPTIWEMSRWRYTAITRAAKKLTYCV